MTSREEELIAERNRIARAMADLRDEHAALQARFDEFAEMCASHSADRAAEQVAAQDLSGRVADIAISAPEDAKARLESAVQEYAAELTRIEGL